MTPHSQELTVARRAMACEFSITFPAGRGGAVEAGCAALDEVERLEERLSVYRPASGLSTINRRAAAEPVPADPELFGFLTLCLRLSRATAGAFDAAAGALVQAWGFLDGPRHVPSPAGLAEALSSSGSRHLLLDARSRTVRFLRPGLQLNPGAIGKGFAIDRALDRVRRRHGVRAALMQGGGSSLAGIGAPPGQPRGWAVDIDHPARPGRPAARVWLRDRALGTSAASNRFFVHDGRRYGHVLDPRTGWPARSLLSASAVARTAVEADALSTAFFVMGKRLAREFCLRHPGVGTVLVDTAGEVTLAGGADMEVLDA